jgi:hypothetical protein
MASESQLALVLLAAFWAGTSAVFAGIKNTNEVRDRIVVGKIGSDKLPTDYLWRLLLVDWLPLKLSLALVSLVLAVIILMLPEIGNSSASFATICRVAAVLPILGCGFEFLSCGFELHFLRQQVRRHRAEGQVCKEVKLDDPMSLDKHGSRAPG